MTDLEDQRRWHDTGGSAALVRPVTVTAAGQVMTVVRSRGLESAARREAGVTIRADPPASGTR